MTITTGSTHGDLLAVENLRVVRANTKTPVVDGVSFTLEKGKVLGLVGESGSGKTTVAHALLAYARRGLAIDSGRVLFEGHDILTDGDRQLRQLRGRMISYVAQNPASALNPALRLHTQLLDVVARDSTLTTDSAIKRRMHELLADVRLDTRESVLDAYPHQLSGGQQQRFMLAMAFACRPRLIVLDEPTTGLDVSTQRHVLDTLKRLIDAHGTAAVYVSHDLAVVDDVADFAGVMYAGHLVEYGDALQVLRTPHHAYTRRLLEAHQTTVSPPDGKRPAHAVGEGDGAQRPLVSVRDLTVRYGDKDVLNGVDLDVQPQSCLAIVGESGAGKTTLARSVAGLQPSWSGQIRIGERVLVRGRDKRDRELRRSMQYIFQSPYNSLNPRKTVRHIIQQWLAELTDVPRGQWEQRTVNALESCTLTADSDFLNRFPHQLSGGQRQRVAIARALVVEPTLLVCDEVTSALDVSAQAAIVELLRTLQTQRGVTIILITHDIPVARALANDVIILRNGIVEEKGANALTTPTSVYAKQLLADVPQKASLSTADLISAPMPNTGAHG